MRRFAELYEAVDATRSTLAKVAAVAAYFREAPAGDAAWALYFLSGGRLKRLLPNSVLAEWVREETQLPDWLMTESFAAVGDFAETVSLLVDAGVAPGSGEARSLSSWIEEGLLPLRTAPRDAQRAQVTHWWRTLPRREVFLLVKMLTGELRVGVSGTLTVRAVAEVARVEPALISHRLMGAWEPTPEFFRRLTSPEAEEAVSAKLSRPYPFCLAHPLDVPVEQLGPATQWQVEWKWDGIRGQLLQRQGEVFLWSRGEELITDRFPELRDAARALPDGTVLDGEVLAFEEGRPMPFNVLQRRIGRQKVTEKILSDAPVVFMAYDLLEEAGEDLRDQPLRVRRARLERLLSTTSHRLLTVSALVRAADWTELAALRAQARDRGVEGFMLKHLDSPYRTGRKKGEWWKWKIDPYSVDAVLVYAHPGSGRRASLFTDYTFAVWSGEQLVPVAKAYSGLSDAEVDALDKWIRAHTIDRFGPVRVVEPSKVFELHFEAIAPSPRHKAGVAVRFPRIARIRADKLARDADTLDTLKKLIQLDMTRR